MPNIYVHNNYYFYVALAFERISEVQGACEKAKY